METQPAREQATVLKAFSRALGREAHVLTHQPDLLWQQIYNRLQWEGEEVKRAIEPELARRITLNDSPWIRFDTPYKESEALVRTLEGHNMPVYACAFSADGRLIVSASEDNTLRIWDASTGETLHTLEGHTGLVNACAFSPDGLIIVSGSQDNTLRMWEVTTGQQLRILEGHSERVRACSFSPDGCFIVSASDDMMLRVWETSSGLLKHILVGHKFFVTTCAFSPDGHFILSASWDKTIQIWKAATGELLHTITDDPQHPLQNSTKGVNLCAFSPDGRFILSASEDKTLRVWDVATGQLLYILEGHDDWVRGCAFSPDGYFILSASEDKTLRVWNTGNGNLLAHLRFPGAVESLGLHPFTPRVVCGDHGGALYQLELIGFEYGPIIVTAWSFSPATSYQKPAALAFGCPHCRNWSEIPESALGTELPCPSCGKPVKLNPFTIQADWRAAAKAWHKSENK